MTPEKALHLVRKLIEAKAMLAIWGCLPDAENKRVMKRIHKLAVVNGLQRKP